MITTIFTDLGGTFRIVHPDKAYSDAAKARIAELTGSPLPPAELHALIESRYELYRKEVLSTMREGTEEELWLRWLCYDLDPERVRANAAELTYQYRQAKGRRVVVEGGRETMLELKKRGYRLGIISDLIGTREIGEWLEADGLTELFSACQLSSVCLWRKPASEIYRLALEEAHVSADECCFVGDNLKRDIVGAKRMSFGLTVAVDYPSSPMGALTEENRPDLVIHRFTELLEIFPGDGRAVTEGKEAPAII